MLRKALLLIALILLVSSPAVAQSVELTPTIGYRFGGDFDDAALGDIQGKLTLGDSEMYGLSADFLTREGWGIELLLTRQSSDFDGVDTFIPSKVSASMSNYHFGGIYQFRRGTSMQPFVVATLGASQLKSTGRSQNGFSYAGGGGVKFYFGSHFGVRAQGSVANTHFGKDDEFICTGTRCYDLTQRNNVLQFEATAGFILRF